METLYSEIHDYGFCMNHIHSEKNEAGFHYCGQRIPRSQKLCQNCNNKQNKEKVS